MAKLISEMNGTRKFELLSRWNSLEYTLISRNSKFAQYADNYHSNAEKLNFTYFKLRNTIYPLNKFARFDQSIVLSDFSTISRIDTETNLLLEITDDKRKVRLLKEIIS